MLNQAQAKFNQKGQTQSSHSPPSCHLQASSPYNAATKYKQKPFNPRAVYGDFIAPDYIELVPELGRDDLDKPHDAIIDEIYLSTRKNIAQEIEYISNKFQTSHYSKSKEPKPQINKF